MQTPPITDSDSDRPPPLPYPAVRILEGCLARGAEAGANEKVLLSNEYGKHASVLDLRAALLSRGYADVESREITLADCGDVLAGVRGEARDAGAGGRGRERLVVVNLCDGTEDDGYPGLSVVTELHRLNLAYTGADPDFYLATTSKPVLKRMLQARGVPTSPFVEVAPGVTDAELEQLILSLSHQIGFPLIVKPSVSYASLCISDRSVVHTAAECADQCRRVHSETGQGVFVERFLAGREFTALCTGDAHQGVKVYTVAERAFDPALSTYRRILAFDRYWDGFDLNGGAPDPEASSAAPMYVYRPAPEAWQTHLADVARRAYLACGGSGYGRVDMRTPQDDTWEGVQVLEVNANCGMSFDVVTSTCGAILNLANVKPPDFAHSLVLYALRRQQYASPKHISGDAEV
ncbi:glutathione synthetase ATP-binding domain-like protein [Gonapodya prolifera JEL478]|uniref:Glutathione synthetase ATP-binding domain-like protein n=1 Tax=Gonapodya prolifera (strain JEL478) TaxID=1344416 RepID=A0A139AWS4_GONPJ|nr:glutathione synthetase ATP-binding domain-like protein [Gonapodya prolifera JEL478]|eukprot:KXS20925.1 glutathione synthetase ATP-binding domain-like protein [Gonapodya prolifera JEL478]